MCFNFCVACFVTVFLIEMTETQNYKDILKLCASSIFYNFLNILRFFKWCFSISGNNKFDVTYSSHTIQLKYGVKCWTRNALNVVCFLYFDCGTRYIRNMINKNEPDTRY